MPAPLMFSAVLTDALADFAAVGAARGYELAVSYEISPAVFDVDQSELVLRPFSYPHQYRVALTKEWNGATYMISDVVVHDVPGAVRAMAEGVELGVSDMAMTDWVWFRLT